MFREIFIFEYVSGGGFNQTNIPSSLFSEGFSMLRTIIDDFKKLNFKINTMLDIRIDFLSKILNADSIEFINSKLDFLDFFKDLVEKCEFCFIIAPEFSNILKKLTEIVKLKKKKLLSIDVEGIELGASKYNTYRYFINNKLRTPKTYMIPSKNRFPDKDFVIKKFIEFNKPIIIKPDDGVGADSIFYFYKKEHIEKIFNNFSENFDINRKFILQDYIDGKHMSLSLLNYYSRDLKKVKYKILSINSQNIKISNKENTLEYYGGHTPVKNYKNLSTKILNMFKTINFSKFHGLFGIDFILKNNKIFFIEINPRLTTSYIAFRNVINKNPIELLLKSKLNNLGKDRIKIRRNSVFTRLELLYRGNLTNKRMIEEIYHDLLKLFPEIIVPPISLNNNLFSCFLSTKEKTLEKSIEKLNEIKLFLASQQFTIQEARKHIPLKT